MQSIKHVFNMVLFRHNNIVIRVREAIIALLVVFLMLFGLVQCTNSDYLRRVDALESPCQTIKSNLNSLQDLLDRGDICSKPWLEDYQDYILRIEEQNDLLEDMDSKEHQELYQIQVVLLVALEDFYETQSKEDLKDLEEATKEYQKLYQENCRGKGV